MGQCIPVPTETAAPTGDTNAYVVGTESGLLVDPGDRTDRLDSALESASVAHVAVTHHHPDHVGGLASCARAFDLTVWARAGRAEEFERATGIAPDRLFRPRQRLPAGDGIGVVSLPGHTPEHVGFSTPEELYCGDTVVAEGSVVVAAPEGEMRAYLSSLRRLYARNPARLFPGHGPVVEDPRDACQRLIEHRLDREQAVLAAVRAGNSDPAAIVETAYEKDISAVFDLARATVVAHLEKLAVEGTVAWDGTRAESL